MATLNGYRGARHHVYGSLADRRSARLTTHATVKPLLSDEELAAQADFIRECRKPHPRPDAKRLKRIAESERSAKDYPLEWEKLPPDEFERRVRKWRKG